MLIVKLLNTWTMTDEEKKEHFVPKKCNDHFSILQVYYNDELILEEDDHGEPEDNSFIRDYKWVKPLLEKVYDLGKKDA